MKIGSVYSASDKALFDALNQSTVTAADLRQLFLSHGIIISRTTNRTTLAAHFSRLVHDYDDFQALSKIFDTGQRRERQASFQIESKAELSDFENAAHEIAMKLNADLDAAKVTVMPDGSLKIDVRYKNFHFAKSEFKQIEIKDAVITLEKEEGMVVIRGPQNEKVDTICRDLVSIVETCVDGAIKIDEISLESFPNSTLRTKFFTDIIDNIVGYKKHDVTDVYVYKPKLKKANFQEDESNEPNEEKDIEVDLGYHISRASLKGEGVLVSEEMEGLIKGGFYISKIVWQARENDLDSDIFEFEAQFTEPESCTKFLYLTRGYYKYQGHQKFSKTRTQFDPEDDKKISKLIELSARTCIKKLREVRAPDGKVEKND